MAASTRQSRAVAERELDLLPETTLGLAEEMFAVANALHSSSQLRGMLSDPSAETAAKKQVATGVFGAKLSSQTVELTAKLATLRWSTPRDLADNFERLGVRAVANVLNKESKLGELQADLFQIQQVISSDPELELALSSMRANSEQKQALVVKLFGQKVSEAALILASQGAISNSSKRLSEVLDRYAEWVAAFANELVANILVARPLSASQLERLGKALSQTFSKQLRLNVELEPEIIGGIRVSVAGEVIDATMLRKITQARLQLS